LIAVLPDGEIVLFSEYAMEPVTRCVQPNRLLRRAGLLLTARIRRTGSSWTTREVARVRDGGSSGRTVIHGSTSRPHVSAARTLRRFAFCSRTSRSGTDERGELQIEAHDWAWLDYRWWDLQTHPPFRRRLISIVSPVTTLWSCFSIGRHEAISQNVSTVRGSHGRVTLGEAADRRR
jgi:hypothetical protein